ncbi:SbcC/MukB-like Walker B domain-containing protein, partial [Dysosmobacter welbionis]
VDPVQQESPQYDLYQDSRQRPGRCPFPLCPGHFPEVPVPQVLNDVLPVVQGLQLEHVHHLVEKVLGPERQRHAALGPACHDLPAEPVRKAHGLRRALPGPDLLQIPAPHRQGGYDAVHDFQRLEGSGDRPVLPARHDVVDPLFLRQEVAARRPAFQVLAPQLDQRLGHVPRPVFRKDNGQLAALVQGGRQVGGHLRPGKSPVYFADGVERGPPEALLHGPVLEQLLVCQVVCVVVQKHRQVSIQRQVFDGLVLILHILLHGLVYVLIGRRGCVGQLPLVPQEGRLLVRLRVSQRVRLLQLVPDFLRGIGSSEIPHKGPGPHNVVRVIEHVRHGVHILLESFRNVRIQKFSLAVSVLEKAVPRHIRLEIFRSPRNGGGELPDLPVNPHALQGVVEPLLGLLALEMGRVPPDEADGLVAVGHQKIVGRVVELVEQLPVLLHRVPDDGGVRALQPFLGFQPPAVLNRQPPLVRPQVEFPRFIHGGVDLRLPPLRKVVFSCQLPGVLDVLRRVLNIPAPLHGVHGVLRRPALDHQLHQGPFFLVQ